jgi:hypothetical protein
LACSAENRTSQNSVIAATFSRFAAPLYCGAFFWIRAKHLFAAAPQYSRFDRGEYYSTPERENPAATQRTILPKPQPTTHSAQSGIKKKPHATRPSVRSPMPIIALKTFWMLTKSRENAAEHRSTSSWYLSMSKRTRESLSP